jgi:hypothetical protein
MRRKSHTTWVVHARFVDDLPHLTRVNPNIEGVNHFIPIYQISHLDAAGTLLDAARVLMLVLPLHPCGHFSMPVFMAVLIGVSTDPRCTPPRTWRRTAADPPVLVFSPVFSDSFLSAQQCNYAASRTTCLPPRPPSSTSSVATPPVDRTICLPWIGRETNADCYTGRELPGATVGESRLDVSLAGCCAGATGRTGKSWERQAEFRGEVLWDSYFQVSCGGCSFRVKISIHTCHSVGPYSPLSQALSPGRISDS